MQSKFDIINLQDRMVGGRKSEVESVIGINSSFGVVTEDIRPLALDNRLKK